MDIATELNELLNKITKKTKATKANTILDVISHYNDQYKCIVTFAKTPETATIKVFDSNGKEIGANANGKYSLDVGNYTYNAKNTGYVSKTEQSLVITSADVTTGTKTVTVTLTAE